MAEEPDGNPKPLLEYGTDHGFRLMAEAAKCLYEERFAGRQVAMAAGQQRTCIICGGKTGSREHLFPAALGGRRTNKGIYCDAHNSALGPHAEVLNKQLGLIGALLGIVSDHTGKPRTLDIRTSEDHIRVSDGTVSRGPASTASADQQMQLTFNIGGPEGLAAIAYIALTFYAHAFPDLARQPGLSDVKTMILGLSENDRVWWETEELSRSLPPCPYLFGHTVVLTAEAASGRAAAVISLHQAVSFAVELGKVDTPVDRQRAYFIDPEAARPPEELQELCHVEGLVVPDKPEPLQKHLVAMVQGGDGAEFLQALVSRIERRTFDREIEPFMARINELVGLSPERLAEPLLDAVSALMPSRVYRLMRHVASLHRATAATGHKEAAFGQALLDAGSELRDDGQLSGHAEMTLLLACKDLSVVMALRLLHGPVDADFLWKLFRTGEGAAIVGQSMLALLRGVADGLDQGAGGCDTS